MSDSPFAGLDPNDLRNVVYQQGQAIAALQQQLLQLRALAEATPDLGDARAGRFIAATAGDQPTDADFSGTFMSAEGETFPEGTFHVGGVNVGELQFGLSAEDGSALAGGGAVRLDKNGIQITAPASDAAKNTIQFIKNGIKVSQIKVYDDGTTVAYASFSIDTSSSGTNEDVITSMNIGAQAKSGNNATLVLNARREGGAISQILLTSPGVGQSEITLNPARDSVDIVIYGTFFEPTFFSDASTNRVGIGTATPSEKLEVVGGNIKGELLMPVVGSPTLNTLSEDFTTRGSSGVADGTLTYITVGSSAVKISVAAGEGYIRKSNDQQAELVFCKWPASTDLYTFSAPAAGQETTIFVGISYNAGNPIAITSSTFSDFNGYDKFWLGRVSYDGTSMRILNSYAHAEDVANNTRLWMRRLFPFRREEAPEGTGGLELSSSLRALAMTAGAAWHGYNRYSLAAVASGSAFDTHYKRSGGGFNKTSGVTAWPNTQYDNGSGTLQTLTNNRYGTLWVYVDFSDGSLDVMYGAVDAVTVAQAQADTVPTTPNHLTYHGRLIGRIIFQKSAASATLVESAWSNQFSAMPISDHNLLSNLQGGAASEYYHLSSAQLTQALQGLDTQTYSVGPATALAHAVRADQIQAQSVQAYTTGGTSTAYTLTTLATAMALTTNERWAVKFNATAGATPTLNRDSKGAKALKYYDAAGAKQACGATTIIANMIYDVVYDGTDYVVMGAGGPDIYAPKDASTTFTPTLVGLTTAGTGTYTTQAGAYWTLGKLVYFELDLVWTAHTGTGVMRVDGLPFTKANNGINAAVAVVFNNLTLTAVGNKVEAQVAANTSTINLFEIGSGAAASIPMDTAGTLRLAGCYLKA